MENGYVKLHRKLLNNPIASKPSWAWLWVVLLLKANHDKKKVIFNNEEITIKRGSFITGRKVLSMESGIAETTLERILDYFVKSDKIGQQKTNKYRLITIKKWDNYQLKRTTNGQQMDTNKNDKNDKNIILATKVAKNKNNLVDYNLIGEMSRVSKTKHQWQDEGITASKYFADGNERLGSILKCFKENNHKAKIAFNDCKELEKRSALYFFKIYNQLK